MEMPRSSPSVNLKYRVYKSTGHSGRYTPENILINNPTDQSSRWSSATQMPGAKQWLLLELDQPSIIHSITFGKFHKQHPCNMKDFSVAVGRSIDIMTTVLTGMLSNTPTPETFHIPSPSRARFDVPIRYVKIIPSSAHNPSFHTSIWHVSLTGVNDATVVEDATEVYDKYREALALRHVLKYLRLRRHFTAFESLLFRTGVRFEHPTLTELYGKVMRADWDAVESLFDAAAKGGLLNNYVKSLAPRAVWTRLYGANMDGDTPCARGGHQMCIDHDSATIYLFGGWDGQKNLDDFWSYSIPEGRWTLLSPNTHNDGGPMPASCHKMVLDQSTGYIYVFGCLPNEGWAQRRLTDNSNSTNSPEPTTDVDESIKAEFYRFASRGINAGTWTRLSEDTTLENGPPLLHDHQMVVDSDAQLIYVFGGNVVSFRGIDPKLKLSGLFVYDIQHNKWSELPFDRSDTPPEEQASILRRFGHSMVFDPKTKELIILAGRSGEIFLSDIHAYNVESKAVKEIAKDSSSIGGLDPSFCQRAALDPESGDIYILPGLLKSKGTKASLNDATLRSSFWIFKPSILKWIECVSIPSTVESDTTEMEPSPRYAHQMVYDHLRKQFFVHGGNAGRQTKKRLDDFWKLKLERPSPEDIVKKMKFIFRQQRFKELCQTGAPVEALTYLQTDVYAVVDHSSEEESATFRSLHSHLFETSTLESSETDSHSMQAETSINADIGISDFQSDPAESDILAKVSPRTFRERTKVFQDLMTFVDGDRKEPDKDLIDILAVSEDGEPMLL